MPNAAQLGSEKFFVARPNALAFRQEVLQRIAYPGVDDPVFRKIGKQSREWGLEVRQDNTSRENAWDALTRWRDFIDSGLLQLILHEEDFDERNVQVKVVDIALGTSTEPPVRFEKVVGATDDKVGNFWVASAALTLVWMPKP